MLRLIQRRLNGERGSAILEFVGGAIMFLIPLTYIMLGVFEVQRGWYGIAAAAREATRVHTLAQTNGQGQNEARIAVEQAMLDQDVEPGSWEFTGVTCEGGCLQSGSVSVATVSYRVELPFLPQMFGEHRPGFTIETTHRTPYGLFRQNR